MTTDYTNENSLRTRTGKKVFPFMSYKWLFVGLSTFLTILSLYVFMTKGVNMGADFMGGVKIVYDFKDAVKIEDIRNAVETLNIGDVQVIQFGDSAKTQQYMLRAKIIEGQNVAERLNSKIVETFGKDKVTIESQEVVGPKAGKDLQNKGWWSVFLTCVLMLVYIGFRFDFLFAPGAVIALVHDVMITVGLFAFFGKEFNLSILAALLTIIGYSINDTIIVYDRIRENFGCLPKNTPVEDVINCSMTETFSRTIVTSLTVLFVVVVLFFLGGPVLHDFAFCMVVGVGFGTYSSVYIATPIYLGLQRFFPNKGIHVTAGEKKS